MNDLIEKLSDLRSQFNCFDENERDAYHTLSEAIKVLSERPEPCEDAVSRQGAIDAIGEVHPLDYNAQAIKSRIEKLPPVQSKKFSEVLRDMMDEDYYLFCHTGYSRLAEKDWEWLIEQVKEIEQSEKENR